MGALSIQSDAGFWENHPAVRSVSCFKPRFALIFDDATFGSFNCF